MTTVTAKLTEEELKKLCTQADSVILTGGQLAEIYETKVVVEKLNKGFENCKVASTSMLIAVQTCSQTEPKLEFSIKHFLAEKYRSDSFEILFRRIDQIANRTAIPRSCFDRTTEHFDLVRFRQLIRVKKNEHCLDDYPDLMQMISECIDILKEIHTLIIKP